MLRLTVLRQEPAALLRAALDRVGFGRATRETCEDREQQPEPYTIVEGKLQLAAIEILVTHHCNLTCRGCSHLSPTMKARSCDPAQVERDLTALAKYCRAQHVRLLGGEPLLHPKLLDVIAAARRSNLAPRIRLVTNGALLDRQPDEFWKGLDELLISIYPAQEPTPQQLREYQAKAREHHVRLTVSHYDRFRESYSETGTADERLIERIYRTCHIAHVWQCHVADGGRVYRCPQSALLPLVLGNGCHTRVEDEGFEIIDRPHFARELRAFLTSPDPLRACRNCLGSVGKLFDNEQAARRSWREPQARAVEELLDRGYLALLEEEAPQAPVLCTRAEAMNPHNAAVARRRGLAVQTR